MLRGSCAARPTASARPVSRSVVRRFATAAPEAAKKADAKAAGPVPVKPAPPKVQVKEAKSTPTTCTYAWQRSDSNASSHQVRDLPLEP